MKKILKIATRDSPLAVWQAEHVQQRLHDHYPDLAIHLVKKKTSGDRFQSAPLYMQDGKAMFTKELQQALLTGEADIAVHSVKDMVAVLPEGLKLSVILKRGDSHDALVADGAYNIKNLPKEGVVGTSSLRRQAQLLALRPDLKIKTLRGSVGTRLKKLADGAYDAIVLAAAGLQRLKLESRIVELISHDQMLPAVGQGAIGIECRCEDERVEQLLMPLNDKITQHCIFAERAFSAHLYGGCQLPVAGFASICKDEISLTGMVASDDGSKVLRGSVVGSIDDRLQLGRDLAQRLLKQGADRILRKYRTEV